MEEASRDLFNLDGPLWDEVSQYRRSSGHHHQQHSYQQHQHHQCSMHNFPPEPHFCPNQTAPYCGGGGFHSCTMSRRAESRSISGNMLIGYPESSTESGHHWNAGVPEQGYHMGRTSPHSFSMHTPLRSGYDPMHTMASPPSVSRMRGPNASPQSYGFGNKYTFAENQIAICKWHFIRLPGTDGSKVALGGYVLHGMHGSEPVTTGYVVERLQKSRVRTHDGKEVLLMGAMDVKQTVANGFSDKVADAFFLGFPVAWLNVFSDDVELSKMREAIERSQRRKSPEDDGRRQDSQPESTTEAPVVEPDVMEHVAGPEVRAADPQFQPVQVEEARTPIVETRTPTVQAEEARTATVQAEEARTPTVQVEEARTPTVQVEEARTPTVAVEEARTPTQEADTDVRPVGAAQEARTQPDEEARPAEIRVQIAEEEARTPIAEEAPVNEDQEGPNTSALESLDDQPAQVTTVPLHSVPETEEGPEAPDHMDISDVDVDECTEMVEDPVPREQQQQNGKRPKKRPKPKARTVAGRKRKGRGKKSAETPAKRPRVEDEETRADTEEPPASEPDKIEKQRGDSDDRSPSPQEQAGTPKKRRSSRFLPPPLPPPRVKKDEVIEAYGLKTSRSGRLLVPPLAYWRNQTVARDTDGGIIAIFEGFQERPSDTGNFTFKAPTQKKAVKLQEKLCAAAETPGVKRLSKLRPQKHQQENAKEQQEHQVEEESPNANEGPLDDEVQPPKKKKRRPRKKL